MKPAIFAVLAGVVLSAAAWIDPLFLPLVLAGPLVSGAVCGWLGQRLRWVVLAWVIAGLGMLVSDWIINNEDQIFHVVLTAVMAALASVGWLLGSALGRLRNRRSAGAATTGGRVAG